MQKVMMPVTEATSPLPEKMAEVFTGRVLV
jgi:hypothetical protein